MCDTRFSQESLSLLLSGGNTGVDANEHIIMSSAMNFAISPIDYVNVDTKIEVEHGYELPSVSLPSVSLPPTSCYDSGAPLQHMPGELIIQEEKHLLNHNIKLSSDSGIYDFKLEFETKEKYAKNYPHCYSPDKNILIAKDNTAIPFCFTSSYDMRALNIKVVAVYSSPDSFNVPVKPCYNHAGSSQGQENNFMSAVNKAALSCQEDGRHCVYLPIQHCRDISNEEGTKIVENLIFHCRSSCSMKSGERGINNRALALIFTLENSDTVVLGRYVLSLKVAVSPGRDIATLEKPPSAMTRKRSRSENSSKSNKKLHTTPGSGKYFVVCNSKRIFDVIKNMSANLGYLDTEYMADVNSSQTSVATQENGSQPEHYSLAGWLTRYGLEHYAPELEENGFGESNKFMKITERDLDHIGILDKCHRLSLIHAAKRLIMKGVAHHLRTSS